MLNRLGIDPWWRSSCFLCTLINGQMKRSSLTQTRTLELATLLVSASVTKTLSESGTRNLDASSIPVSETLVQHILQKNSLDTQKKIDFFKWCSHVPGYKHSACTYSQIFHALCRGTDKSYLHDYEVRNLLGLMKQDGVVVDSSTFKLLLDAFIQSGQFDSALDILDGMEELGVGLNTHMYNSVIVALVRKKQLTLALSMFNKLLENSNVNGGGVVACEPITCNELLVGLRRVGMKEEFKNVFYKLREKKVSLDTWGYNICIHTFGCWGDLETSLRLFKEMRDDGSPSCSSSAPDLCTYNSLIQVLCLVGKVKDALIVWEELKGSGHEPDAFTYRIIIQGCCKSYRVEDATRIFNEMQLNGFQPDTIVYNSLLDGFLKAKRLAEACQLFEKMTQDGVRATCWTYNILINGLIKNGRAVAGYTLFCDLKKKGQFVDGVTYSIIILHLCKEGQLDEALQLVEEMEPRGLVVDLVTISSLLITLYKLDRWDSVQRLMKYIRDGNLLPNVLKWKSDMEAALKHPQSTREDFTPMFPSKGDFSEIMDMVTGIPRLENQVGLGADEHLNAEIEPDVDEWSSSPHMDRLADHVVSPNNRPFWLFSLSRGRRIQGKGMSSFDIDMVNTYLSVFLAKKNLSVACKLFEMFTDMGVDAVSYTYNSITSAFVKKGYFTETLRILTEMGEKLCPADIATYNLIIQSLGKTGRAYFASSVLDKLIKQGGYLDIVMYNTLINALGKAGKVDEAKTLFKQMKSSGVNPDVVTFNTLIEVHAKAGRLKDAYEFLRMMLDAGCPPNHVTDTILDFLGKEMEKSQYQKASIKPCDKVNTS